MTTVAANDHPDECKNRERPPGTELRCAVARLRSLTQNGATAPAASLQIKASERMTFVRTSKAGLAALALAAAVVTCCRDSGPTQPRRVTRALPSGIVIPAENANPGTADWILTSRVADSADLAAWASPYAPHTGDTLSVFVRATHGPVSIRVFRLGWYGGLGATLKWQADSIAAHPQPPCSPGLPGPVECHWAVTLRVPVDSSWTSGAYLLKVIDTESRTSFYPFVVKDGRRAAFLAILPQFTWQAYNAWGGASLYLPTPGAAPHVSFERPYVNCGGGMYLTCLGDSNELYVIRFLERLGYDVTYESDVDLALADRRGPDPARGVLFLGHDEYWTWGMYDEVHRLRGEGEHLFFFAGNNAYWNVRLSPSSMLKEPAGIITCFKSASDPEARSLTEVTTRFRDPPLNRPENSLYGIMYPFAANYIWVPGFVANPVRGKEAQEFLAAAGLHPGDSIPNLIRGEGDRVFDNGYTPRDIQVLFQSPYPPQPGREPGIYQTAFWITESGGGVFATGTNAWGRQLDDLFQYGESVPIQRLTQSVLDWMIAH